MSGNRGKEKRRSYLQWKGCILLSFWLITFFGTRSFWYLTLCCLKAVYLEMTFIPCAVVLMTKLTMLMSIFFVSPFFFSAGINPKCNLREAKKLAQSFLPFSPLPNVTKQWAISILWWFYECSERVWFRILFHTQTLTHIQIQINTTETRSIFSHNWCLLIDSK